MLFLSLSLFLAQLLLIVVSYVGKPSLSEVNNLLRVSVEVDLEKGAAAHSDGPGTVVNHFNMVFWKGDEDFLNWPFRRVNFFGLAHFSVNSLTVSAVLMMVNAKAFAMANGKIPSDPSVFFTKATPLTPN